jgi:hypothetical protein
MITNRVSQIVTLALLTSFLGTTAAAQNISGEWYAVSLSTHEGQTFTITQYGNGIKVAGKDWVGDGSFDGAQGRYNWVFWNGTSGYTAFTYNSDGSMNLSSYLPYGREDFFVTRMPDARQFEVLPEVVDLPEEETLPDCGQYGQRAWSDSVNSYCQCDDGYMVVYGREELGCVKYSVGDPPPPVELPPGDGLGGDCLLGQTMGTEYCGGR